MEPKTSSVSWVVVVMAACSLFSMIGTFEIDGIVHHDLYKYGLQFSYAWASPYWTMEGFVFAVGWINIIIAMAFHIHAFVVRRKTAEASAGEAEEEMTPAKVVEEPREEKARSTETEEKSEDVQVSAIDKKEEEPVEAKESSIEATPVEAEEGLNEEKTETMETEEKLKDVQVSVIDQNAQEKEEKPVEVKEAPTEEETTLAKAVEEPKEEETKPTETEEKPKDVLVFVVDQSAQGKGERQLEAKEPSTEVKQEMRSLQEDLAELKEQLEKLKNQREKPKPEPSKEGEEAPIVSESAEH